LDLIYSGLKPDHNVLDVGSGIGRVALPLTQYLNPTSHYIGIEIIFDPVSWCYENIHTRYPNFEFKHVNAENPYYNDSKIKQTKLDLPVEENYADFIFMNSVFTHLHPEDSQYYVRELSKKIKIGGLFWCTWFIIDDESTALMEEGMSRYDMLWTSDEIAYYPTSEKSTVCVGYRLSFIESIMAENGFVLERPVDMGGWCGRKPRSNTKSIAQDVFLFRKS